MQTLRKGEVMAWRYQIVRNTSGCYGLMERYIIDGKKSYGNIVINHEYESPEDIIRELENMLADAKKYRTEKL